MAKTSRRSDDDAPLPEPGFPEWFSAFLADRAVRKPSPHTAKAYRQDFAAIAQLLAADRARIGELTAAAIEKEAMRAAFAAYADSHEAASVRRCWSTWNTLCAFLYTDELIQSNPMPLIGRPKVPKSLPKALGVEMVSGLLEAIDADSGSQRRSDWPERDAALVLIAVLAGLRADELLRANVGDIRTTTEGGIICGSPVCSIGRDIRGIINCGRVKCTTQDRHLSVKIAASQAKHPDRHTTKKRGAARPADHAGRRHGIASAQAICPSKPSVLAMAR